MDRILLYWRCLSQETLLKLTSACSSIVATCFIGLVELYYSPHVYLMESSPTYPEWLKWFARILLVMASTLSVVIAVRAAREDFRRWMLKKHLSHGTLSQTLGERFAPSEGNEKNQGVVSQNIVDDGTEVAEGTGPNGLAPKEQRQL